METVRSKMKDYCIFSDCSRMCSVNLILMTYRKSSLPIIVIIGGSKVSHKPVYGFLFSHILQVIYFKMQLTESGYIFPMAMLV